MLQIDFDHISDEIVYDIFQVDGSEGEALCDTYLELFELMGRVIERLLSKRRQEDVDGSE